MLTAPKQKSNFTPAPAGTHLARCIRLIHIGTIDGEYMGEPKEFNKIRLTFELPNETKVWKEGEDAKPIVTDQEYTLSMTNKANLRKFIEGVIGTSLTDEEANNFDVESILGMACLITIKHKTSKAGNVRAEIASASPLMKGQVCPPAYNPLTLITYSNWSEEVFDKLPQFIKDSMESSREYQEMRNPSTLTEDEKETLAAIKSQNSPKVEEVTADEIPF